MSPSSNQGERIGDGEAGPDEPEARIDGVSVAEALDYPPAELKLALRTPIVDAKSGDRFDDIRLEEPTDQQWAEIYAQPADLRRRFAISHIANIPMGVVAQMKISDVVRAETYIWGFFGTAQTERPW